MTTEDQTLIEKYGIETVQRIVYLYKDYRYDHLKDAVNYAKVEIERNKPAHE